MKAIEIIKTTAKGAMLISDGEKVAWVSPRMRRNDGTFTPGAYKALEEGVFADAFENEEAERQAKDIAIDDFVIARETEKAVALEAAASFFDHVNEEEVEVRELVWMPKSMVKEGRIAKWFVEKKLAELNRETRRGAIRTFSLVKK